MTKAVDLYLVPEPKRINMEEGSFNAAVSRYIRLDTDSPQALIPAAKKTGLQWEITASPRVPSHLVGFSIALVEDESIRDQGYRLRIRPECIDIAASDPAGAYYGACTIAQILRQYPVEVPCLSISDWPDFPARGVMIDISRDKVPTMDTLYHLVDLLSDWKINQLQLYLEHTFAYLSHPAVWEHASPMTGEQILALDAYCKSKFVELVPNQNSFGHMERWLKHDDYRSMAESPDGCDTIWGWKEPFSLCPVDERSVPFIGGLYDELLPHFTSRLFNVGLDETVDLGCGRSKEVCEQRGVGRVYLDYLLQIHRLVKERGLTMMFWGDIIVKQPELIRELPADAIALQWGYEFDDPFDETCATFKASGIPFYVVPGTSSWNSICGRTDNAIGNIGGAARNGLAQGAIGLLNTDWGDYGHWQPLSVSYLGFMAGAMASWNAGAELSGRLAQNLSIHAFMDGSGRTGRAFYDLGNLYTIFKERTINRSIPWQILFKKTHWSSASTEVMKNVTLAEIEAMECRLSEIMETVKEDDMTASDAMIVRAEMNHIARILELAALIGKIQLGEPDPGDLKTRVKQIKKEQRHVWLLRNRIGGLRDSLAELTL